MGKILALDFGTKRIGYAVSDEKHQIAFPRDIFPTVPYKRCLEKIRAVIKEENIFIIILGLPLDSEGEEGESALRVVGFGTKLARDTMIPVEYVDESGTTAEALSKIPLRKSRRLKGFADAIAAQLILRRYLERL